LQLFSPSLSRRTPDFESHGIGIGSIDLGRCAEILTLLSRAGQRIGDWSTLAGRHGVLGMTLGDINYNRRTVTVRLKGARDEHRVPVADDFWPWQDPLLRDL
jgi:hypothetical protein